MKFDMLKIPKRVWFAKKNAKNRNRLRRSRIRLIFIDDRRNVMRKYAKSHACFCSASAARVQLLCRSYLSPCLINGTYFDLFVRYTIHHLISTRAVLHKLSCPTRLTVKGLNGRLVNCNGMRTISQKIAKMFIGYCSVSCQESNAWLLCCIITRKISKIWSEKYRKIKHTTIRRL